MQPSVTGEKKPGTWPGLHYPMPSGAGLISVELQALALAKRSDTFFQFTTFQIAAR